MVNTLLVEKVFCVEQMEQALVPIEGILPPRSRTDLLFASPSTTRARNYPSATCNIIGVRDHQQKKTCAFPLYFVHLLCVLRLSAARSFCSVSALRESGRVARLTSPGDPSKGAGTAVGGGNLDGNAGRAGTRAVTILQ